MRKFKNQNKIMKTKMPSNKAITSYKSKLINKITELGKNIVPAVYNLYDPCCGSGGMFVELLTAIQEQGGQINDISIYGQEIIQNTWQLANMNLAIRNIDAKYFSNCMWIFNLLAYDSANENNVIDFLVEIDKHIGLLDHATLTLQLQEFSGCTVDVVSVNGIKPRILDRVLKVAVAL